MNRAIIKEVNKSWLKFIAEAMKPYDVDVIFQTSDLRTDDGDRIEIKTEYVIAAPVNEWVFGEEGASLNFRLGVLTGQKPGDILVGHHRNLDIQILIEQAIFGSDRLLEGVGMGDVKTYSIPLVQFNASGDPVSTLDAYGIRYTGGNIWRDRTPDGSNAQFWVLEIPVTVNL